MDRPKDFRFLDEIIASANSTATGDKPQLDIRAYTAQIKQQLSTLEDDCIFDFASLN